LCRLAAVGESGFNDDGLGEKGGTKVPWQEDGNDSSSSSKIVPSKLPRKQAIAIIPSRG